MPKSAPLSPPKCQKHGIWGEECSPSPKFDSPIVAFGGGWEGAGDKPQNPLELARVKLIPLKVIMLNCDII